MSDFRMRVEGGCAKDGTPEGAVLEAKAGDVICVVGPTGSGKSQLLSDIECLAEGDTPSRRVVTVCGRAATDDERFSPAHKLVAQIYQSMNYVMELSVSEFLELHAESRSVGNSAQACERVLAAANTLCGEPFDGSTPVCLLSGGQSRALMIADVAVLSQSPVVLIDELENAGVNKRKSLDLLMDTGKVVFIATHNPLLMLQGPRRVVMDSGRISAILQRTPEEERAERLLENYEEGINRVRDCLRAGGSVQANAVGSFTLVEEGTAWAQ